MKVNNVVLKASGLSKQYAAVRALDQVDLELRAGQVHALVGSNGAGKSTLVKILTGSVVPDSGELILNGQRFSGDTKAALDAGIASIYQDSQLVPALSVLDNIMLGRQPTRRFGFLNRTEQRKLVTELLRKHELDLALDSPTQALSPVQQKEVEISKALSLNAQILLMDEPTASLSRAEVEKLFRSIRGLQEQGVAILYISHILDEIFAIADHVSVLRDGKIRHSSPISQISKQSLVESMLGQELVTETRVAHDQSSTLSETALELRGLSKAGLFDNIDLQVHTREIVCITGLVGAKRTELMRAIFGVEPADQGQILIYGLPVTIRHPLDAIRQGLGFVPEDRRRDGLFMNLPVSLNIIMASLYRATRMGVLSTSTIRSVGNSQIADLAISPPRLDLAPRALSGGNQQKVLLGRWLTGKTRIILLDEPTVGIDVGTKANIYALLRKLAAGGKAILIVSSDIEEVLTIADRVVVMATGRIIANFSRAEATQERILKAASGETNS
jgi:ABC-type sugar transport system ATPase subunit